MSTPTIEPRADDVRSTRDHAAERQRQVSELLDRREDLRGISELADVLQHCVRWSV